MGRKIFTNEFKVECASLVLDQGYSVPDAARVMDVGETAMRRWVKQLKQERAGTTPETPALTEDKKRIQELEAHIRRLEKEKQILKKATVDSIDQCNTHVKIWVAGGSLNETCIYRTRERVDFRLMEIRHWL